MTESQSKKRNLRAEILKDFADGKPHRVSNIAAHLGVTVEELVGTDKVLRTMHKNSRDTSRRFSVTLEPDGRKVTIRKIERTVSVDEIDEMLAPFLAELKGEARKAQASMLPVVVRTAVARIEECIDLWAGRPSKFELRKARILERA